MSNKITQAVAIPMLFFGFIMIVVKLIIFVFKTIYNLTKN